eukprot:6181792-Pleurochrysis_carterae.AAC.2
MSRTLCAAARRLLSAPPLRAPAEAALAAGAASHLLAPFLRQLQSPARFALSPHSAKKRVHTVGGAHGLHCSRTGSHCDCRRGFAPPRMLLPTPSLHLTLRVGSERLPPNTAPPSF